MPNNVMRERWHAASRRKAERGQSHAELTAIVGEVNFLSDYMREDPESPLNIAQSLIDSAYLAAMHGGNEFARRNYVLTIGLLQSVEKRAKEDGNEVYGALFADVAKGMRGYAIAMLERLPESRAAAPSRLEQLVA